MFKREIEFEDLEGNKRKGEFYFNLTKAELMEMELGHSNTKSFSDYLSDIVAATRQADLIREFKGLILVSYGVKGEDGVSFIKSEELSEAFTNHPAFHVLFWELATDDEAGAEFVNGVIPSKLAAEAQAEIEKIKAKQAAEEKAKTKDLSTAELAAQVAESKPGE